MFLLYNLTIRNLIQIQFDSLFLGKYTSQNPRFRGNMNVLRTRRCLTFCKTPKKKKETRVGSDDNIR